MATFGSHEAWENYYRAEGFKVGVSHCNHCGHVHHCAIHPEADPSKLECPECRKQDSRFGETGKSE